MKRICLILALAILCPVILCSCGSADSVAKDYIEARYINFDATKLSETMLAYDKDLLRDYVKDFDSASVKSMLESLEEMLDNYKDAADDNDTKYDYKIIHTEKYDEDSAGFKEIAKSVKNGEYGKSLSNAMTAAAKVYAYISSESDGSDGETDYAHQIVTVTCIKVDGKGYVLSGGNSLF